MMTRYLPYLAALGLSVGMLACKDAKKADAPAKPAAAKAEPAAPAEAKAEVEAEPQIPVPADFEAEVAKEITDDNYEAALDEIEKQLAE